MSIVLPPATAAETAEKVTGILALLIGWVGQVPADVMMVVMASIAGALVHNSSKDLTVGQAIWTMVVAIIVGQVLAWSLVGAVISRMPSLDGPYAPSIVAFVVSVRISDLKYLVRSFTRFKKGDNDGSAPK